MPLTAVQMAGKLFIACSRSLVILASAGGYLIAGLHGGRIRVASEPGKDSIFTITFGC